ncbi:MAG: N-acetylmuramoyl-L-alanine amidase [Sediminibacterium sp.]|nr:N-acetylmuramoyl-L-alanine amidase [Sediminibacterium sp.]
MIMKKCSWLLACMLTLTAAAQEKLVIMGTPPDLWVVHTVGEAESMQTISNQFGQSVTKLSTYNGIAGNATLAKGAQVKIPLTQYNLIRVKGDENSAPVYHIIQKGENLFKLSKSAGVSVTVLKEWNDLKVETVKDGQAVIVGYMVNAKLPAKKEPAAKDIAAVDLAIGPGTIAPTPGMKYAAKKEPATPLSKSAQASQTGPLVALEKEPPAESKKKPEAKQEAKQEVKAEPVAYSPKEGDEGYFAAAYNEHPKEQALQFHSGDAATFKTISGWADRKYYVLINDVAPETIVRLTGPGNKSICAKVLGPLQETKGGAGLMLRMSNAAASALGITEPKFTVTVTYFE